MTAAIEADFKTEPYLHQLREFEVSADLPARALLWQMRTGKTKVVIDQACHLFKAGKIDAVLLFAPNGVHENWTRRELPRHHWDSVDRDVLVWRTDVAGPKAGERVKAGERGAWKESREAWWAQAKAMLSTDKLAWFAFAAKTMARPDVRKLVARILKHRRVLVVFDEAHDYRKPGSKRSAMARALAKRCLYRRTLTGTPVTNSPLHAWAQYELLEPGALGFGKYSDFKSHYAVYQTEYNYRGQGYQKLDHYRNLEELTDRLAPWSSVVLRSDCHDLPDLVRRVREIELSDEQVKLYRELHGQFEFDVGGVEVTINEDSSRLAKLQQVVSGFIIDEYGDTHDIPGPKPRLDALSDEAYLCPGKFIVWCQYHYDLDAVASRLTADGLRVVEYHGRIGPDAKQAAEDAFRDDPEVRGLVGQPQSGGHGLDFSEAAEIFWYSHTFDGIVREQADERATEIGGLNIPVVDFMAPGVDHYIRDNVLDKVDVADAVAGEGLKEVLRRIKI